MPLTQQEIKTRAYAFVKEWENTSRERAEAQTFWNDFFNIFGLSRRRVASFEEPVKKLGDERGSIDLFWKGTLLVEHKSKGRDLTKAYGQALDYFPGILERDLPQYVLVSDFANFRLYDLDAGDEFDFSLNELPEKIHLFGFISGYKQHAYHEEDPVNTRVAEKMGELHDELLNSGYKGHPLEVFLVRLVYILFADDTGIFPKDNFHYFLENRTNPNGFDTGSTLALIFQMLKTPNEKRQSGLDEELLQFQYVNGGLFEEVLPIPVFNAKMRNVLLECCSFDWSKVSPAIFGSMFQSVMDRESSAKRREIGAHYTSETNILKVIRPLFLDELHEEFQNAKNDARKLNLLHYKISSMRFFDPACGCGNFLIITYRELRRLEIEILKQLRRLSGKEAHQMVLGAEQFSRIDVDSLYGVELEEFPARVAEAAIWLTDHQMNMELSQEFGVTYIRLPLEKSAHIKHGNALQMDWSFVPKMNLTILGNPPFIGKHLRTAEQNADMDLVCAPLKTYGVLDYVSAWYVKAVQFIKDTNIKVAFVSTNSITQGEQVGALWNWMLAQGVKIHFAHRTFRWVNDARGKAAVFCVIIGFGLGDVSKKRLFDYASPDSEAMEIHAKNINPYLVDAENIIIDSRNKPVSDVPEMYKGSSPTDDGNLLFTDEEKVEFLKREPNAEKFIRPMISAHEFLHNENRWCLWLKDISPAEMRSYPEVMKRVNAVREFRLKSKKAATVKYADLPYLFMEIRQPDSAYVFIPRHSSENRQYIPFAFFSKENIANDSSNIIPNATLYHFGVISSIMHMAWMRAVCGRLESRYRYSNNIVYNNFPWALNVSEKQKERVKQAAQEVLNARKQYPDSSLADLYDPSAMPKVLVDAHRALDKSVDLCYRPEPFKTELERLEFLFALYRQYTEPMNVAMEEKPKRRKKK
ncbi:MAG: class I SAM-dependent DNA methyltransferase [Anaerolineales bacterium]|nr:class I SAM-dependent DNA methyltransferase [Anaerolineales bacterium]